MEEHIKLLEKEINCARRSFQVAMRRPGVTKVELENLERKIRIKTDLLVMVRRFGNVLRETQ